MRVSLYPSDRAACGNYRMVWPGEVLANQSHDVTVNHYKAPHRIPINVLNDTVTNRIVEVQPVDADVVVLQRPASARLLEIIERIKDQGVKVVVDVDDALWAIHRRNVSWASYNNSNRGVHWKWLLRSCKAADLVTVTTPALQEKVGGVVIPNFLPERALEAGRKKLENWRDDPEVLTVGWAATQLTHPTDPKVTGGELPQVIREHGARFMSVGGKVDRELQAFGFGMDDVLDGRAIATGEVPKSHWQQAVSRLDVSLVPLDDTPFNEAKSWLKMLESAAAGCAVVASPTFDNVHASEYGIGVIAKERKWGRKVGRLLEPGAAKEQAMANFEAVEDLTIENKAWMWWRAWQAVAG